MYLLSAREMKEYLPKGRVVEVSSVFYGEVAYPLETYDLNYHELYSNDFILDQKAIKVWHKIPPAHYFYGSVFTYSSEKDFVDKESLTIIGIQQGLYTVFILILPILIIFLTVIIIVVEIRRNLQKKST